MTDHTYISLLAALDGRLEEVPARAASEMGEGVYQLLASPGVAEGAAVGDFLKVDVRGRFEVLQRSGYLSIQAYPAPGGNADVMARAFSQRLRPLGGALDGGLGDMRVFRVHIDCGFPAIEAACAAALDECPGAKWMFGNVYEPNAQEVLPWIGAWLARGV